MTNRYPPHVIAQQFPPMDEDSYAKLREDIRANGLMVPIVLYRFHGELCVLDGVHRQRACDETGAEPRYEEYAGDDPIAYALSLNLARRHLNDGQRALLASGLVLLEQGQTAKSSGQRTAADIARMADVGESTVRQARTMARRAEPEVTQAVRAGEISLNAGAEIAKLDKERQLEQVKEAKAAKRGDGVQPGVSRAIRIPNADAADLLLLCERADKRDVRIVNAITVLNRIVPWLQQ